MRETKQVDIWLTLGGHPSLNHPQSPWSLYYRAHHGNPFILITYHLSEPELLYIYFHYLTLPLCSSLQRCSHLFEKWGVHLYWGLSPKKGRGAKHFLPYTGQKSEGPRPSPGPLGDYITVLYPAFMPSCL